MHTSAMMPSRKNVYARLADMPPRDLAVLLSVAFASSAVALIIFRRRDIAMV